MNKITIFTPTYNRAYIIKKLYDSIKAQNYPCFEWVIVDDGSTDNTKELINSFILEKKIDIKYFYQKNSGKHVAINKGVEESTGNLFFIVDSDDYITPNALNIIDKWEKTLDKDKYAGVAGLKVYENNDVMGTTFKNESGYVDATSLERGRYNIEGEKAEVFYTDILKKYKFPSFEGENFITEAYIWNKIARDGYQLRWFNEPLMVCEYLEDGLTKNLDEINKKNPKGYLLFLRDCIKFEKNYIKKIKQSCWYVDKAKSVYTNKEIKEQLDIGNIRLYILILLFKIRGIIKRKI